MSGLLLGSSDEVTTTLKWSSAHLSPFTQAFSQPSIIISDSLYSSVSSVFTFPSSLIQSLTYSLSFHPVFHCLARPLFRGCGSAGHRCAMSFSERSQEFSVGAEPPLSFFTCSPVFPLPRLLSLCLSPSITPHPPFPSHESRRLTASPKSESWNRWNMNGSLVYEKGVWVKEAV